MLNSYHGVIIIIQYFFRTVSKIEGRKILVLKKFTVEQGCIMVYSYDNKDCCPGMV